MRSEYIVTVSKKFQAWDEAPQEIEVTAKTAKDAIATVKYRADAECWFSREDGAIKYTAKKVDGND